MNRRSRQLRLSELAGISRSLREDSASGGPGSPPADLTASILMRVDDQRQFLSGRDRRRVHVVRWALGGVLALTVLASAMIYRFAPQAVDLGPIPQPASRVIAAMQEEAGKQAESLRETLDSVSVVPTPRLSLVVAQVARTGVSEDSMMTSMSGSGGVGAGITVHVADGHSAHAGAKNRVAGCFVGPFQPCRNNQVCTESVRTPPTFRSWLSSSGCAAQNELHTAVALEPVGTHWLMARESPPATVRAERVRFVATPPAISSGSFAPVFGDESVMPR